MSNINLKWLADKISNQDNRSTSNPLFCVYDIGYVIHDDNYSSHFDTEVVWVDDEGNSFSKDDQEYKALEILCDDDEITVDGTEYKKINQTKIPRFVTACFTEAGAKMYLEADGHNLNEPYIYVHSLNRNTEMIGLREHIVDSYKESDDE